MRFCFLIVSFVLFTGSALAQAGGQAAAGKVATSISPTSGTVGQPFVLRLKTATLTDAYVQAAPLDGDDQTTWAIVEKPAVWRKKQDGQFYHEAVVKIAPFLVGELTIPQFALEWKDASGSTVTLVSDALPVVIESVLPETSGTLQLKQTKAPLPLPVPKELKYAAIGLGTLLLGALLFFVYRTWGHRVRALMQPMTPDAEALSEFAKLEEEKLIEQKRVKEYYTRLSDALRAYAGRVYGVPALDLTTSELVGGAARAVEELPAEERESLEKTVSPLQVLLEEADLVKFARHFPTEREARKSLEHAREIVAATRFRFSPKPETKGSAATKAAPKAGGAL